LFDKVFGGDEGTIVYRGESVWEGLPPGEDGHYLTTHGADNPPSWQGSGSSGGEYIGIPTGDTPPSETGDGGLWWDSVSAQLYVRYNDGTSEQWVIANSKVTSGTMVLETSSTVDTLVNTIRVSRNAWNRRTDFILGCLKMMNSLTCKYLTQPFTMPRSTTMECV
jgi:hypothetical protein